MQDNLRITSLQRLFYRATIDELEILDKNGRVPVNQFFLSAFDCSGMYENSQGKLSVFPPIINWNDTNNTRITNIGWMFSNAINIVELQEHPLYPRESPVNTIKAGFMQQSFEYCDSLRRIGPRLDVRAVVPGGDATLRAFAQCISLEDVLIYGLNAGTWRFDSNTYEGFLNNLSQDSMNYLFNNLLDLTNYDESIATETINNSWGHESWTLDASTVRISNGEVYTTTRYPNNQRTFLVFTTSPLTNMQVKVQGLLEQDILILPDGTEVTTDGTYTITTEGDSQTGFSLVNTGITESQVYEDPVRIFITHPYFPYNIQGDSGSIYFPEQKQCTITSEMVQQARQKGWTIYVNNIEQ